MVREAWWLKIMGIAASTNVKEIRIDQRDAKWDTYPSTSGNPRESRVKNLGNLGKRWLNSAEGSNRRYQQLTAALEATEKRAHDAEQRVRQLERDLATLELRNMELAEESTWLKKQLSDRPEVPFAERPPTSSGKNAAGSESADNLRAKQMQYVTKLENQIKLYEEDILKMKTKMSKETQRLQAELEDQKYRSEREMRCMDNRLIEAHKLNQKYEEAISSKISPETLSQLRAQVTSETAGNAAAGADPMSQSKSRAQLILELTEEISAQQDRIRQMEDEIVKRDIELAHLKVLVQKSEEAAALSASFRKTSRASGQPAPIPSGGAEIKADVRAPKETQPISMVASDNEIDALLNRFSEPNSSETDEENELPQTVDALSPGHADEVKKKHADQLMMNASLRSVPPSWRKEQSPVPPTPKPILTIVDSVDGNNLAGVSGPARPKTVANSRQKPPLPAPRHQSVVSTGAAVPTRQASVESQNPPNSRTHSAPMFAFKARPSSRLSTQRTSFSSSASAADAVPFPVDFEDYSLPDEPPPTKKNAKSHNVHDAMEVLSLHEHETASSDSERVAGGVPEERASPGSAPDADDDDSDQEIRRRFEQRSRKSAGSATETPSREPRPPAGGGVGQAAVGETQPAGRVERTSNSAKSHDSGFLGDSCASTHSLKVWTGRNKKHMSLQRQNDSEEVLDVDKLLDL